jgi:hypothetical protein
LKNIIYKLKESYFDISCDSCDFKSEIFVFAFCNSLLILLFSSDRLLFTSFEVFKSVDNLKQSWSALTALVLDVSASGLDRAASPFAKLASSFANLAFSL